MNRFTMTSRVSHAAFELPCMKNGNLVSEISLDLPSSKLIGTISNAFALGPHILKRFNTTVIIQLEDLLNKFMSINYALTRYKKAALLVDNKLKSIYPDQLAIRQMISNNQSFININTKP